MNENNIVAAILATSDHSPAEAFNRYEQLQELLAQRQKEELPDGMKKIIDKVEEMRNKRATG